MFKWLMAGFGCCVLLSWLTGDGRPMAYGWGILIVVCMTQQWIADRRIGWPGVERDMQARQANDAYLSRPAYRTDR